jgi:hypothetical protein
MLRFGTGLILNTSVDPASDDRSLGASGGSVHLHLLRSPTSSKCETGIVRTRPEPSDPLLRRNDCALKSLSTRQREEDRPGSMLHSSLGERTHGLGESERWTWNQCSRPSHPGPIVGNPQVGQSYGEGQQWRPLRGCRYLPHDRDAKFCPSFRGLSGREV